MPHRLLVGALLTAALLSPAFASARQSATHAAVGHPPPPFALPDEHGVVHALDDLKGRPIILYFTHNVCHYCTQVIAFLKRAYAEYEGTDLAIVTFNVWAKDGEFIRRYKEAYDLPFDMLAGNDPDLLRDYEVNYVPIIIFVGRDGNIRHLYEHYVLQGDFEASTAEIVEGFER